ncbi:DUF2812 domain-containing protein [Paenibacillus sp. NPDC058071]|uniref:DUF2812 domain-containing protein n=1 Tax=Paenibacillus sp. NPDC058071 TaxID=3346326 RepID=UPI0036D775CC
MRKYRFFTKFEKEEQWLNEMARNGYKLTGKQLGYRFELADPENANIRIDYRKFKSRSAYEDYRALFEDSGWEHAAGGKDSGYQYFRRRPMQNGSKDEHIFSDEGSKAGRYKRVSHMYLLLALLYIPIFAVMIWTGMIEGAAYVNPKALYFTPGLWEKTGAGFWGAFLFETPFALFRGAIWLFLPATIVLYLGFALKADRHYRRTGGM